MKLTFTPAQVRQLLLQWGFTFSIAERHFRQPVYHNDIEEWTNTKELLMKDGVPYKEPTGYGEYSSEDWFKRIFWEELSRRFADFVISEFK